jgi:hypothetical protein
MEETHNNIETAKLCVFSFLFHCHYSLLLLNQEAVLKFLNNQARLDDRNNFVFLQSLLSYYEKQDISFCEEA